MPLSNATIKGCEEKLTPWKREWNEIIISSTCLFIIERQNITLSNDKYCRASETTLTGLGTKVRPWPGFVATSSYFPTITLYTRRQILSLPLFRSRCRSCSRSGSLSNWTWRSVFGAGECGERSAVAGRCGWLATTNYRSLINPVIIAASSASLSLLLSLSLCNTCISHERIIVCEKGPSETK